MKKVIPIIIVICVIVALVVFININKKEEYKLEEITEYNYYQLNQNQKVGVINTKGEVIVEPVYDTVEIPNPTYSVFICKQGENIVVLNEKSENIFTNYEEINSIKLNGIASNVPYEKTVLKYKKDGKYGLIDYSGKVIAKPIYEEIENLLYKEGELLVKQDGKYGVINIKGTVLVKPEYDGISSDGYYDEDVKYRNDGYIISTKTDEGYRYGYIDYTGKQLLKMEYNDIFRINNIEEDDIYLVAL